MVVPRGGAVCAPVEHARGFVGRERGRFVVHRLGHGLVVEVVDLSDFDHAAASGGDAEALVDLVGGDELERVVVDVVECAHAAHAEERAIVGPEGPWVVTQFN